MEYHTNHYKGIFFIYIYELPLKDIKVFFSKINKNTKCSVPNIPFRNLFLNCTALPLF